MQGIKKTTATKHTHARGLVWCLALKKPPNDRTYCGNSCPWHYSDWLLMHSPINYHYSNKAFWWDRWAERNIQGSWLFISWLKHSETKGSIAYPTPWITLQCISLCSHKRQSDISTTGQRERMRKQCDLAKAALRGPIIQLWENTAGLGQRIADLLCGFCLHLHSSHKPNSEKASNLKNLKYTWFPQMLMETL